MLPEVGYHASRESAVPEVMNAPTRVQMGPL